MTQMLDVIVQAERDDYDKPGKPDQPFDKRQFVFRQVAGCELAATFYRPRDDATVPAAIWVHGGGWRGGDRGQFARHAALMAARDGIASLCISYRLTTVAPYPACVQDARAAVRWLRANAQELGIDSKRVAIGGSSAGGHIAALVAANSDRQSDPEFDQPIAITAMVLYNPVLKFPDRLNLRESVTALLGPYEGNEERYRLAAPMNHVSADCPPTLLLHGRDDQLVPFQESLEFADRLRACGVCAQAEIFDGAGHGQLNDQGNFQRAADLTASFLKARLF